MEDLLEIAKKYKGSNPRYTRVTSAWLLMVQRKLRHLMSTERLLEMILDALVGGKKSSMLQRGSNVDETSRLLNS